MILSGWRIYDASPLFRFRFPDDLTLGGWLAGALQWHFAAMWLLIAAPTSTTPSPSGNYPSHYTQLEDVRVTS
jgi:hypothetical protein